LITLETKDSDGLACEQKVGPGGRPKKRAKPTTGDATTAASSGNVSKGRGAKEVSLHPEFT
jgi:hypothetical protein